MGSTPAIDLYWGVWMQENLCVHTKKVEEVRNWLLTNQERGGAHSQVGGRAEASHFIWICHCVAERLASFGTGGLWQICVGARVPIRVHPAARGFPVVVSQLRVLSKELHLSTVFW